MCFFGGFLLHKTDPKKHSFGVPGVVVFSYFLGLPRGLPKKFFCDFVEAP